MTPTGVECEAAPDLGDERESGERERQREPYPAAYVLVPGVPCPQGDEDRRGELEQQRDPDRQPVDGDEVEPLHEREAADAVEEKERDLPARQPQPVRVRAARARARAPGAGGGAQLGETERGDARVEQHLRHGAVDREERRRDERHRVAESRTAIGCDVAPRQRDLGHRMRLLDRRCGAGSYPRSGRL